MFGLGNETVLKGKPPTIHDKKSFKDSFRYFCTRDHWDRSEMLKAAMDEDGEGYLKPTIKLFFYNCWTRIEEWWIIRKSRFWFKKIFSKYHLAGWEVWDCKAFLAPKILKSLKAFRESERHGYPSIFSEYSEHDGSFKSKEDYDNKLANGDIIGGGSGQWDKELDHMIMAFQYLVNEGTPFKNQSKWFIEHFGMDPYEEGNLVNGYTNYTYKPLDAKKNIGCVMNHVCPDLDTVEWCTKEDHYMNHELIFYAEEIVQQGIEKFARYFQNLWD